MKRISAGLLTAAFALTGARAGATDTVPGLELKSFDAPTDPNSGLRYEPASSPATGDFNTAFWLSYAYRPVTLRGGDSNAILFSVLDHQLTGDVTMNVGLFERVALGVDLPFAIYQHGGDPTAPDNGTAFATLGQYQLPATALGDMKIVAKGTIIKPTSGDSSTPNAGFTFGVIERFGLPTGNQSSYLGEGHITSETRLLADYDLIAVAVHATLGAKLRAQPEDFGCAATPGACPTRFGHELPFGLAFSLKPQAFGIDQDGHWTWFIETYGHLPMYPKAPFTSKALSQVQLGGGARYTFENDISLLAGVDFAMLGGIGTAPVRGTLAVAWAPRKHDADDDGVLDKNDECPEFKEDRDGFEDNDGCPDIDNDGDGVKDADDKCDGLKEDMDGFQDDDGCPDPDNDEDGIPDVDDHCPNVKGVWSKDPVERGCPDPDPDKDGVKGDADKCPNVPGRAVDDGCPNPDWDGDGINNDEDKCPEVKGVPLPDYPDFKGCPDADGDGIPDAKDACQQVAGVRSEDPQKNGCPEEKLTPQEKKKREQQQKLDEQKKKADEAKKKLEEQKKEKAEAAKKKAEEAKLKAEEAKKKAEEAKPKAKLKPR